MSDAPRIALLVFTNGRGDCLARTLASFCERVEGEFSHRLMIDDSVNLDYARALDATYGDKFQIIHHAERKGFAGAIQSGWNNLPECEYIFSLEDDFTLETNLRLADMVKVLEHDERLCQVVLKRQVWNEQERRAGGIVEIAPDDYTEKDVDGIYYLEHARFFSTNPNLMPYAITRHGWLQVPESEGHMSFRLRDMGYKFAMLGKKFDPPRVMHIGEGRAVGSKGY